MPTWGAIFDWDGVIIDSSRHHEQAWERLAQEEGRTLPPGFFLRSFGMRNERVIRELLGWTDDPAVLQALSDRKEEHYRAIIRAEGIRPLPGVCPFLERLHQARVPCAVASSTPRRNIDCVIEQLGLPGSFQAIVAAEDVRHGKPHPEVFLRAAEALQLPPTRCAVFEDAHVGIQAALAAGMKVIGVATTHPAASLQEAHRIVHRLDELDIGELGRWVQTDPSKPPN